MQLRLLVLLLLVLWLLLVAAAVVVRCAPHQKLLRPQLLARAASELARQLLRLVLVAGRPKQLLAVHVHPLLLSAGRLQQMQLLQRPRAALSPQEHHDCHAAVASGDRGLLLAAGCCCC